MKKQILLLMLGIFLVTFISNVSAVSDDDISYFFKHGEKFDLKRECYYNGAPCNVTTYMCYITTYYPNGSLLLNGSAMSGQTNFYNKTFYSTTYPLGVYRNSMYCTDGTLSGSDSFYFRINQTGDGRTDSLFLILALGSVIVLGLAFIFQNEYIGFIAGALWITLGVYTIIFGFSDLADMYTRTIGYVSIGLGAIFIIASGYKVAEETNFSDSVGGIDYSWNWKE